MRDNSINFIMLLSLLANCILVVMVIFFASVFLNRQSKDTDLSLLNQVDEAYLLASRNNSTALWESFDDQDTEFLPYLNSLLTQNGLDVEVNSFEDLDNLQETIDSLRLAEPQVFVFFEVGTKRENLITLVDDVQLLEGVEKVGFTSEEEAIQIYKLAGPDGINNIFRDDPDISLPSSLDIFVKDLDQVDQVCQSVRDYFEEFDNVLDVKCRGEGE